jgi:hypothetical protein
MLLALVLVAAVLDLREREHRWRFAGLAAGIILLSGVDLNVRVPYLAALVDAMMVVFAGLVVWRAYIVVMCRQRPVADRIVGAICVYVLLGLAWAKTYEALDGVAPGSIEIWHQDEPAAAPSLLRYIYFSFVTLATVGRGDVSPVTALAGTPPDGGHHRAALPRGHGRPPRGTRSPTAPPRGPEQPPGVDFGPPGATIS